MAFVDRGTVEMVFPRDSILCSGVKAGRFNRMWLKEEVPAFYWFLSTIVYVSLTSGVSSTLWNQKCSW